MFFPLSLFSCFIQLRTPASTEYCTRQLQETNPKLKLIKRNLSASNKPDTKHNIWVFHWMISGVRIPEFISGVSLQKHPPLPQMTARWQKDKQTRKKSKLKWTDDINVTSQLVFTNWGWGVYITSAAKNGNKTKLWLSFKSVTTLLLEMSAPVWYIINRAQTLESQCPKGSM